MILLTFNINLTRLRKEKGLSQEQLALEIGVSRQSISKWERGVSQPELSNIDKICEVLEITPNELMGYIDERSHKEKSKNISKSQLFVVFVIVVLLFVCIFAVVRHNKEEYHGFYVNDFQMETIKEDYNTKTYLISFVPSIINNDFEYSIMVEYESNKKEVYDAYLKNSLCLSEITISSSDDAVVYAQIKVENLIFTSPLVNVIAPREVIE